MHIRAPSRAEPLKRHLFVSCLDILPFLFEFVKMIGKYKYELYSSWLGAEWELALFLFSLPWVVARNSYLHPGRAREYVTKTISCVASSILTLTSMQTLAVVCKIFRLTEKHFIGGSTFPRRSKKMKRCILVATRQTKDKESGDALLFLTLCDLPKRMKNGGLFYPKKTNTRLNKWDMKKITKLR